MELKKKTGSLKLLCSYGGKILPRSTDGKLRYVGGLTRVLTVDRSVSFAELMVKLGEFCGFSVTLKCQLPNGDLETLISIKSDEDLANLIEEYDRCGSTSKIRAILAPPVSLKQISPPSSVDGSPTKRSGSGSLPSFPASSYGYPASPTKQPFKAVDYVSYYRPLSPPYGYPVSGRVCYNPCHVQGNPRSTYCGPLRNHGTDARIIFHNFRDYGITYQEQISR